MAHCGNSTTCRYPGKRLHYAEAFIRELRAAQSLARAAIRCRLEAQATKDPTRRALLEQLDSDIFWLSVPVYSEGDRRWLGGVGAHEIEPGVFSRDDRQGKPLVLLEPTDQIKDRYKTPGLAYAVQELEAGIYDLERLGNESRVKTAKAYLSRLIQLLPCAM